MTTQLKKTMTLLSMLGVFFISSCDKEGNGSCFDAELQRNNENMMCLQDCPGVTGCDGKFYCNECIAAQNGITVVE